ncbi:MAG: S1C family serine protease [Planctomycetota bacterium]|jgi:S1-C subfamily serine protease
MRTLALFLALAAPVLAQPEMDKLRAAVVQVFIVTQSEDYARPWQRPRSMASGGSAFYIGDKMLLTNAHIVSDSKVLRVKRADRVKKYEARVLFAGHDCDLAIMTVDDAEFFEGMEPLRIGNRPVMQSTVATVGYPMGGNKLSITEGVVSRIEVRNYSHTSADAHLTIQTDAAINPGNSGGPVMQDGKVVGVAFQGQFFAQNIGYMIPPSVMRHFLEDVHDGTYHGYPELGVYTANLENVSLRAFLGVPESETGVLVLKPMPYASTVGNLRRNDVLHRIDGIPIENDGTIKVDGEFFEFTHVVENKQIGDTVTLTVRREGKVIEVPIKLKGWDALMSPAIAYDERPDYLFYGGHLFVPVTTNYLMRARPSEELMFYYRQYYRTVAEEGKTREQLVLLSRVLPHPSTRYRAYNNAIVAKVDGVVPNDFRQFVELIEKSEKNLVKVDFEGVNVAPLILDKKKIAAVHDEIRRAYGVTGDRHVKGAR